MQDKFIANVEISAETEWPYWPPEHAIPTDFSRVIKGGPGAISKAEVKIVATEERWIEHMTPEAAWDSTAWNVEAERKATFHFVCGTQQRTLAFWANRVEITAALGLEKQYFEGTRPAEQYVEEVTDAWKQQGFGLERTSYEPIEKR